ncbi:FAD-dependent monooxygenase [Paraburkholderia sp. J63]|uniref:FAD-dependent monooxygenase n=1 Tax=Paraburkholderia sp. J63 TaxID=2805434 RepID=UPI002ABE0FB3|nr:FAD-dependent monooxygenase [Paraburkholderia sp. J63]
MDNANNTGQRQDQACSGKAASGMSLDAPVIVAGAGPAGMCLAIDLALSGINTLIIESREEDERFAARTNLTNTRSMEHFRRWGMADALRRNIPLGPEISRDIRFVTRGTGHVIANFVGGVQFAERVPFASEISLWGPQGAIERTIRQRIATLHEVDLRFQCAVKQFTQHDDHVEVVYEDAKGTQHTVRGRYLVGADGSRSIVRRQLGIKMDGTANLAHGFAWLIHSPALTGILERGVGLAAMSWFTNEDRSSGILGPQDSSGHFQYFAAPVPDDVDGDDWETVRRHLYSDVGETFPVEPVSGGDIRIHSLVAPRFFDNRVFLIGDAAHLVSPFGGFGMNISIGDSADLAWKLAAVLNGWGGPTLLASYDQERRSAFRWIQALCEESTEHVGPVYVRAGMEEDGPRGDAIRAEIAQEIFAAKSREFVSIGAQLGYTYADSPIVVPNGAPPAESGFGNYVPSAAAGARAPHVWLDEQRSLYDAFGRGFTLLKIGTDIDTSALERAALERNVPLAVLHGAHPDLPELYGAHLVLIRPDQHVAWRGNAVPADPGALLDTVRGGEPCRP